MPTVRGGMGNHSGAVPGEGKVLRVNQPKADRRQYGKYGKDFLECGFWIVSGRLSVQDIIYDALAVTVQGPCGSASFPSAPISFFGFLPFLPAGRSAVREYRFLVPIQKRFMKS